MLKICFVASSPFTINAFLSSHILELSKHFLITIICAQKDSLASLKYIENVEVYDLKIGRMPNFFDLVSIYKLSKIFLHLKPICVMSVSPKAGILTMLASALVGLPNRVHFFTGQVWANKSGLPKLFLKIFDALIIFFSTRCFVDSTGQLDFLKKELFCQFHKLSLLGPGPICGIDLNRFQKNQMLKDSLRGLMGIPENAIIAMYLGRVNQEKGVLELFKAFEYLIYGGIDDLYLIVVGPMDGIDKVIISQMKERCGDRVAFKGNMASPEKILLLADFLVLPSHREGFGMVVAEAGAASIPSIVSDIYGLHDVIRPEITGLQVPPNDYLALANAMKRLTLDKSLRDEFGRAAHQFISQKFSSELITKYWVNFFKALI